MGADSLRSSLQEAKAEAQRVRDCQAELARQHQVTMPPCLLELGFCNSFSSSRANTLQSCQTLCLLETKCMLLKTNPELAAYVLLPHTSSGYCQPLDNFLRALLVAVAYASSSAAVPVRHQQTLDLTRNTLWQCAQPTVSKGLLSSLQTELQQVNSASEQKAAELQADLAVLQQRIAAAEAELTVAQTRVQQLEQQLQAQLAEASATEKRMAAQMDQLKMDVSMIIYQGFRFVKGPKPTKLVPLTPFMRAVFV